MLAFFIRGNRSVRHLRFGEINNENFARNSASHYAGAGLNNTAGVPRYIQGASKRLGQSSRVSNSRAHVERICEVAN